MLLNLVLALLGALVVFLALLDVFQSVIIPRAVDRRYRMSAHLVRGLWSLWPQVGWRLYSEDDKREEFLSTFAPFALVVLLAQWVLSLIVGYGLIFFALRAQLHPPIHNVWQALYFAGSSLLTIGFGDIVGRSGVARMVSLAAGVSGLSVVGVLTAFLFAVFSAFQRREVFVVSLGARSGSPPSGIGLLVIHAHNAIMDDLPALFVQGQQWTAEVMESHLAYPILAFFRSSHDYESWVGALGSLLDAATLLLTTPDDGKHGQARIQYWIGRHLCNDFVHYFQLQITPAVGIERYEFVQARERLAELGFKLRDEEESWQLFSELRMGYAPALAAMARFWSIPPLQWIGDRSIVRAPHITQQITPTMASEQIR